MNENEFKSILKKMAGDVNNALEAYVPSVDNRQKVLVEAMRYSLLAGGKRIRPVLCLAMADCLGVKREEIMPYACGLEMIHTSSLIFDDLPCMDNDDYRRGRYSCHKQFGEYTAVLAGIALFFRSFEIGCEASLKLEHKERGINVLSLLSTLSNVDGMVGGQFVDLESEGKKIDMETLRFMYATKTGALIKAPAMFAIALAGAEGSEKAEKLIRFSEIIGLAFQLKDDILDVEGDQEKLGKPIGSDAEENKSTFVALRGLDECKKELASLNKEALAICEALGSDGEFLLALAEYLFSRDN